jgi:MFS family permease
LLASFSIFYVALLNDLKWSRADTALALTIFMGVTGLAGPVSGWLFDRYKPKWVMSVGTISTALALLWLSQIQSQWEFYLAYGVLASAGSALIHIVPLTAIVSKWFMTHRGMAIGIVTAGQGVGQVCMPILQYAIDHIGWRQTYLIIGALLLFVPTILILLFLERRPEDRGLRLADERLPWGGHDSTDPRITSQAKTTRKREVIVVDQNWAATDWTVGKAVRTDRFWTLTILMALFATGFMMMAVQLAAYLTDKGYSSLLAASVIGLQGAINIFGRFFGGVMSDHIGREKTLTLSVASSVICLLLLHISGIIISPPLVYVFSIFYGIGSGMTLPVLMAATGDLFQGKNLGSIIGVLMIGGFAGGALGVWGGGYLYDVTKSYEAMFIVAGTVMIASGALIWKARPSQVRIIRTVLVSS